MFNLILGKRRYLLPSTFYSLNCKGQLRRNAQGTLDSCFSFQVRKTLLPSSAFFCTHEGQDPKSVFDFK